MKRINLLHIAWIIGIFATLITILYLVVVYKVKWEDKDLNTYLYFYDCGTNLCSTTNKPPEYYSKVLCEEKKCPYIKDINDNYLILKNSDKAYIYNYLDEKIISDNYRDYTYLGNNYYSVTDEDGKVGVIDLENNLVVECLYEGIKEYKSNLLVFTKDNKYGVSKDKETIVQAIYDDIVIINDRLMAFKENNKYYISDYYGSVANSKSYDYIYAYNDVILVISDKTIDILNDSLSSVLIMKINTTYDYSKVGEIKSLKIKGEENILTFKVFNGTGITNYTFDIKNKKLFS